MGASSSWLGVRNLDKDILKALPLMLILKAIQATLTLVVAELTAASYGSYQDSPAHVGVCLWNHTRRRCPRTLTGRIERDGELPVPAVRRTYRRVHLEGQFAALHFCYCEALNHRFRGDSRCKRKRRGPSTGDD